MPIGLPSLHDGHSSIAMQNAFHEAVEAIEMRADSLDGELVLVNGAPVSLADLIDAMMPCTDLMPIRTRDVLEVLSRRLQSGPPPLGSLDTFGSGARLARRYCEVGISRQEQHAFIA